MAFKPKPLSAGMLLTAIVGFMISAMYTYSGRLDKTWGFTFSLFFIILFISVFVSLEPTKE